MIDRLLTAVFSVSRADGPLSAELLKNGTLKTYKGYPHGMITTQADVINTDLLAFIKS
jgi:non-heme chloroperoxidase